MSLVSSLAFASLATEPRAIEQHIHHGYLEALRREEGVAREVLQELAQGGFD